MQTKQILDQTKLGGVDTFSKDEIELIKWSDKREGENSNT